MSRFRLFGNKTPEITDSERAHRKIAFEAACEGIVLLKNDGALPLRNEKIALYGAGARMTVKGGTGSGNMQERYSVNIEQGLKIAGYQLRNTSWLDRYDSQYEQEKEAWRLGIEERIKGYKPWEVQRMFDEVIHVTQLEFPIGDEIRESDLSKETDTAIYVVARQAGESKDRELKKGDYYLSDVEEKNIRLLAESYEKLILIINSPGIVDLSVCDEVKVNAIVYLGQAGEEGGNALAQLLKGTVNFSGHLADSWAMKYEDYPYANEYGKLGNVMSQDYKEGIYVGYRWFDINDIEPRYPFGYGLSYTDFEIEKKKAELNGSVLSIDFTVTNTGKCSGKETVQVYLRRPSVRYLSEKNALVGFVKTDLIPAGKSQTVTVSFDLKDWGCYDEEKACKILEKGEYGIFVGNNSRNCNAIAVVELKEDVIVEKLKNVMPLLNRFELFKPEIEKTVYANNVERFVLDSETIETACHEYGDKAPVIKSEKTRESLNKLSDDELIELCVGAGFSGLGYNVTPTAVGRTSINLLKKGIPNVNFSDGPAGLNLCPKNAYSKLGIPSYIDEIPKDWQWGWIKKMEPLLLARDGKGLRVYQYMTAFPSTTLQAQSWNVELLRKIGKAIADEMVLTGVTLWLAPAMNIHRNLLCGRNFEYYSEDPFVSGTMASAITEGVQSVKGVGVTIKHFCCNNQEGKRETMSENVNERALREIYLKGFEIAVKKAKPWAVMTSYNLVNGVHTYASKDLCTEILRNEWGFEGLVMTDWGATKVESDGNVKCMKSGNNLIMPGDNNVKKDLKKALANNQITRKELEFCAADVLNVIFNSNVCEI
ncbi:MAG: glycoside hydrolase family 3 C-terminal domain-containing protein [Erysipelotrichaceae bacterium]|nr:glycoside hydrolase family 3 C-terminal domain-containing protein [Erysipelotrichaceae bacterium]